MPASEFQQLLQDVGPRPYRDFVEHFVRKASERELAQMLAAEVQTLSAEMQDDTEGFIDVINQQLGHSEEFWRTATCLQAYEIFVANAIMSFRSLNPEVSRLALPRAKRLMALQDDPVAMAILHIPTMNFAYSASDSRAQRKFMGIRKGIFG